MRWRKQNYAVEEVPGGRNLVVTGPWGASTQKAVESGRFDGLVLNYARGFSERSLAFIGYWPLRRLEVLDRSLTDLEPIGRLGQSLEYLSVEASEDAELDFGSYPLLRTVAGEWGLLRPTLDCLDGLRSLITWRFDETDLVPLIGHDVLSELTIKDARRLESLSGAGALSALDALGVHLAPWLADVNDVTELATTLRTLRFEDCRSIEALDDLAGLTLLTELWVADCGEIESLSPLSGMVNLERLWAWGTTRIADGDLAVLTQLPRLRELRLRPRKHYRPTEQEVKARLPGTS